MAATDETTLSAPAAAATNPDRRSLLLEVRGVDKCWKRRGVVLEDAQLALNAGEVVLVHGRNGAGKTTLLRIAAGLIRPDRGTVSLAGLDSRRDRRTYQRLTGYLPATNSGIYARLTVRQNLELWSRLAMLPPASRAAAVLRSIERFALDELADGRADRLSMGQRQRVRLALTTLHAPLLLLLDEPTNSLDVEGRELLAAVIRDHRAGGGGVVWCAPDPDAHGLQPDRALELREGRLA